MIAIDTNILVRVFVDDASSPEQVNLARGLVRKAGKVFIPQIVQVEVVWVLESAHNFTKDQVLSVLKLMLSNPALHLQNPENFAVAVGMFADSNADFSDCLIFSESKDQGCELWTFDRKLGRLEGANRLTGENL